MRTDHFWEPLLTLLFLSFSLLFFLPLKTSPESPRSYFKPAHPRMTALPLPTMLWRLDIEMRQLHHSVVPKAGRLTCWLSCSVRSESLSACSLLCFCFVFFCCVFCSPPSGRTSCAPGLFQCGVPLVHTSPGLHPCDSARAIASFSILTTCHCHHCLLSQPSFRVPIINFISVCTSFPYL